MKEGPYRMDLLLERYPWTGEEQWGAVELCIHVKASQKLCIPPRATIHLAPCRLERDRNSIKSCSAQSPRLSEMTRLLPLLKYISNFISNRRQPTPRILLTIPYWVTNPSLWPYIVYFGFCDGAFSIWDGAFDIWIIVVYLRWSIWFLDGVFWDSYKIEKGLRAV